MIILLFLFRDEYAAMEDYKLAREILLSSRDNVNFIHEIFRQALRLSFRHSGAMRDVILCYHDWIKLKVSLKIFKVIAKRCSVTGETCISTF